MNNTKDDGNMTSFKTGATRDTSEGKLDMEGFTHPMVEKQFAKYMSMNRLQSDGQNRDSDNWQKGIDKKAYMKSLRRHHDDVWLEHRGFPTKAGVIAALCGIIFNAKGLMHELLKESEWVLQDFDGTQPTPEIKDRQLKLERDKEMEPAGCGHPTIEDVTEMLKGIDVDEPKDTCDINPEIRCSEDCPAWARCFGDPLPETEDIVQGEGFTMKDPAYIPHTGYCLDEFNSECGDCSCMLRCIADLSDVSTLRSMAELLLTIEEYE